MAFGDLAIALEPWGYQYPTEEGASFSVTGHDFRKKALRRDVDNFFIPPGSPWIMPRVKQFNDKWDNDPDKVNHVQALATWNFQTTGVTARAEYVDQKDIGGSPDPARQWLSIRTASNVAAGTPPINVNLNEEDIAYPTSLGHALKEAKKIDLPNLYVVAATKERIPGRKAPYLRASVGPEPDDLVVFGAGRLAFVIFRNDVHVLIADSTTLVNWTYLGSMVLEDSSAIYRIIYASTGFTGISPEMSPLTLSDSREISFQEFGGPQVGLDEIWLGRKGFGQLIRTDQHQRNGRKNDNSWRTDDDLFGKYAGKWWIALPAQSSTLIQVERCAYDVAQHVQDNDMIVPHELSAPRVDPLMFNFGDGYSPTPEPEHFVDCIVHGPSPALLFLGYEPNDVSIGGTWSNAGTGEAVHYRLLDDIYLPWQANGTQHAGIVHLKLTPADDGESAPQVRLIMYKWAPVMTYRTRYVDDVDPMTIGLTEIVRPEVWNEFRISASMLDPDSKQFECIIKEDPYKPKPNFDETVTLLAPYEKRTGFPVEIWKDINGNDQFEQKVGAAWITKIEKIESMWVDADLDGEVDTPIRQYRLVGRGLAKRLRQPWAFTATIDSPNDNGRVSHIDAVKQAAFQGGFADDPAIIRVGVHTGSDGEKWLPGDIRSMSGASGSRPRKSAFHPDWNQIKLDYILLIALGWSGWNFYERIEGLLVYEPDMLQEIHLTGDTPDIATTFYASHQAAIDAGFPNRVWLSDPAPERMILELQANVVRVYGKGDEEGSFSQVIVKDEQSIQGPTTYQNFNGEPKVVVVHVDIAVNEDDAHKVAWMMLERFKLRGELLRWRVPKALWSLPGHGGDTIDVGDSCNVQMHGNHVIVHSEVEVANDVEQYTNYTGWKWPARKSGSIGFG